MKVFTVIGIIWCVLLAANIIVAIISGIIRERNLSKFKNKIQNSDTMEKIFNKLTPEEIDKLKTDGTFKQDINIDMPDNTADNIKTVIKKYKDCKVKDMNSFLNKLADWLKKNSKNNKADVKNWYRIIRTDGTVKNAFSFEIYDKNIFVTISSIINEKDKIVNNICGFNDIDDLEELLKSYYQMQTMEME